MDGEEPTLPNAARLSGNRLQIDNAIRALHNKKPVPEIDFTLHTMEDGSEVSTLERVCKGMVVPMNFDWMIYSRTYV
jgi:serine/threonine-protein phosphatase 2B catalytic subunit